MEQKTHTTHTSTEFLVAGSAMMKALAAHSEPAQQQHQTSSNKKKLARQNAKSSLASRRVSKTENNKSEQRVCENHYGTHET